MSFGSGHGGQVLTRRQRRLTRARWWFQCMRQVVERATDWQPVSPPRPEQIWFPGSHREIEVAPPVRESSNSEQQQICE